MKIDALLAQRRQRALVVGSRNATRGDNADTSVCDRFIMVRFTSQELVLAFKLETRHNFCT
jgi:hypothetical protein